MATAVNERERVRKAQAKRREGEREISIPACIDPARREACEADVFLFLATYFAHKFYNPLTDNQRAIVRAVLECAEKGGDRAIAAPRGDGKTTLTKCVILYCVLTGRLRYPVILAANGLEAKTIIDDIKNELEKDEAEGGEVLLAEDYPEVCVPIHALSGWASRAKLQRNKADGRRTKIVWRDDFIVLPTVTGSKCSGSAIRCRGMDAAIRGMNYRGLRPDFVLMDDPESDEDAGSLPEIKKREKKIERGVAGLRGQSRKMGRLILCTIQNRFCLAAKFTDRTKKPWHGLRFKQVIEWPTEHEGLWRDYLFLRRAGKEQEAVNLYLSKREAMDAGAVLANCNLYDQFGEGEISALQHCYNFIGRSDDDTAFLTEYQNDPPEESGPQESGIKPEIVSSRTNAFARRQVPDDCTVLTCYIDLGKYGCHWTATAWRQGATGFVIDYGVAEVFNMGTAVNDRTVDWAILTALRNWKDQIEREPFMRHGENVKIDTVLVDSSDFTDAAYAFCKESGPPYFPAKGFGQGRFYPGVDNQAKGHRVGQHWYTQVQPNGVKLVGLDADHWKLFCHNLFMTATYDEGGDFKASAISLFSPGNDKRCHLSYSQHICAEIWTEEHIPDKGLKRGFKSKNRNNHWLDATAGACAAASMCGIKIVGEVKKKPRYVSLDSMAKKAS